MEPTAVASPLARGEATATKVDESAVTIQHDDLPTIPSEKSELSRKEAIKKRQMAMYGEGMSPWWKTEVESLDVVSFGIVMYFKFLIYICTCFILMSLFAIPIAWICHQGTNLDDLGLPSSSILKATVANLGTDTANWIDPRTYNISLCSSTFTEMINGTVAATGILECPTPTMTFELLEFGPYVYAIWDVAFSISMLDVAYSIVFLIFILYIPSELKHIAHKLDDGYLSASDYAVYVTGLPHNFAMEDLRRHFSDLYDLSKAQSYSGKGKRCCQAGRPEVPPLIQARYSKMQHTQRWTPVQQEISGDNQNECSNEGTPYKCTGGWVAEVTLALHNQAALHHLTHSWNRHNAVDKVLGKLKKLEAQLHESRKPGAFEAASAASKREKHFKKLRGRLEKMVGPHPPVMTEPAAAAAREADKYIEEQSRICGAYVIFEHQESRRRCQADYAPFQSVLTGFRMPEPLLFMGHRLTIVRAPEPATIVWENVEVTDRQRSIRRCGTCCVTAFLILLSLLIIIAVKGKTDGLPTTEPGLCSDEIMATYYRPSAITHDGLYYDFTSVLPTYEPDSWVIALGANYSAEDQPAYGFAPVVTDAEEGMRVHCPLDNAGLPQFEIGVRGSHRETESSEDDVRLLPDEAHPLPQSEEEAETLYMDILSRAVGAAEDVVGGDGARVFAAWESGSGEYALETNVRTRIDRDMTARLAHVQLTTTHRLLDAESNATLAEAAVNVTRWSAEWPARQCWGSSTEEAANSEIGAAVVHTQEDKHAALWELEHGGETRGPAECGDGVTEGSEQDYSYDLRGVDPCFSPCYNALDYSNHCPTYKCSSEDPGSSYQCQNYWIGNVPSCFCELLVAEYSNSTDSWVGYVKALYDISTEYPVCAIYNPAMSYIFTIVAVLMVAITNLIMNVIIIWLVEFELHHCHSERLASVMSKAFVARLVNTAVVILAVQSDGVPGFAQHAGDYRTEGTDPLYVTFPGGFTRKKDGANTGVMQGDMKDFSVTWYEQAGYAIALQMLVNIFEPHMWCAMMVIYYKMRRSFALGTRYLCCCWCCRTRTQKDLNDVYHGESLDVEIRYSQVLNTVFVTMIYAAGMPLLIPMAALSLILTFLIDKYLLFRYYNLDKLRTLNGSLAETAVKWLPTALLMHLAFGCWMYANPDVTYSSLWADLADGVLILDKVGTRSLLRDDDGAVAAGVESYSHWLSGYEDNFKMIDVLRVGPRVIRWNVAPIFMLFVGVVCYLVLYRTLGKFIIGVFKAIYQVLLLEFNAHCRKVKVAPELDKSTLKKRQTMLRTLSRQLNKERKKSGKKMFSSNTSETGATLGKRHTIKGEAIDLNAEMNEHEAKRNAVEQKHMDHAAQADAHFDADGDGDVDIHDVFYSQWRDILEDFYSENQESKNHVIDDILRKFKGREIFLFESLSRKYVHASSKLMARAHRLHKKIQSQLDSLIHHIDLEYEPPYTGFCRKPVRVLKELEYRRHLIEKFGEKLSGWERLDTESWGLVHYHQKWVKDGIISENGLAHADGDEKRTWEVIRGYAPFSYRIENSSQYRDKILLDRQMRRAVSKETDEAVICVEEPVAVPASKLQGNEKDGLLSEVSASAWGSVEESADPVSQNNTTAVRPIYGKVAQSDEEFEF